MPTTNRSLESGARRMICAGSCLAVSLASCWRGRRPEEEIVDSRGLLSQFTERLVERALEVEITDQLGYERYHEPAMRDRTLATGRPAAVGDRAW